MQQKNSLSALALMSCIYIMFPMSELPWGFNRVFKYIGFYAVGALLARMDVSVIKKELGAEIVAIGLLAMLIVSVILVVCSMVYEAIIRITP